jgi:hypothetical protein
MAVTITRRRLVIAIIVLALVAALATAVGVRIVKRSQEGKDGKGPPVTLEFAPTDLAVATATPLSRWLPVVTEKPRWPPKRHAASATGHFAH